MKDWTRLTPAKYNTRDRREYDGERESNLSIRGFLANMDNRVKDSNNPKWGQETDDKCESVVPTRNCQTQKIIGHGENCGHMTDRRTVDESSEYKLSIVLEFGWSGDGESDEKS